jgi:hypothetical protein
MKRTLRMNRKSLEIWLGRSLFTNSHIVSWLLMRQAQQEVFWRGLAFTGPQPSRLDDSDSPSFVFVNFNSKLFRLTILFTSSWCRVCILGIVFPSGFSGQNLDNHTNVDESKSVKSKSNSQFTDS